MNKTIKSGVRKLLFCMISKYEEKQQAKEAKFLQKQDCLRIVVDFLANLKEVAGVTEIMRTIERLTDLEHLTAAQFEKNVNESFESITADDWKKMTDHVIHVEAKYKERDRITEDNLESFIINVGGNSSDDTSDSDVSLQAEFLESDFDSS